ncbi:hypothetical protein QFC24_006604 [Naganishia onofrii]|uniref:Uncharacterized protein n=1 Tax=Naganishia onofrii TaxID=1851511 RepID=A0ACC2WYC5_9TREE|nr:hypothetical protein QFC24_006604 [Naganishia onofrii]
MDVIGTFEAVFLGKTVFDATNEGNSRWSDPLATFIYVACELLIPVAPFGGCVPSKSVLFWGKNLSRNQVIARVITVVMGHAYSSRNIFSHKQAIIKGLLERYIDDTVEPYLREYAGVALQRFAGTTPLCDYFRCYIDNTPPCPSEVSEGAYLTQVFAAQQIIMDRPDTPVPAEYHQDDDNLALHPFLAFLISINGNSHEHTHFASYFKCAATPKQVLPKFGRNWWDYYVMSDTERKHEYGWLWLDKVCGQDMNDILFYHRIGPPPTSDGGPFWGRYTPFTHLHREDCGHPKLYEGSTVFHGRPKGGSAPKEATCRAR